MAAARLQRWAVQLGAYDYEIKFRPTQDHCNADGLSRLPLNEGKFEGHYDEPGILSQIDCLPVMEAHLKLLLATLTGGKNFTYLDLADAYHQLILDEDKNLIQHKVQLSAISIETTPLHNKTRLSTSGFILFMKFVQCTGNEPKSFLANSLKVTFHL